MQASHPAVNAQTSMFDKYNRPRPELATQTRDASFAEHRAANQSKDELGLNPAQRRVYDVIRIAMPDVTNFEIAWSLGIGQHEVSPRTLELREMGLVIEGAKRLSHGSLSKRKAQAWRVKQ